MTQECEDTHGKKRFVRQGRDFFDNKEVELPRHRDAIRILYGYDVAADVKMIGGISTFVVKVDLVARIWNKTTVYQVRAPLHMLTYNSLCPHCCHRGDLGWPSAMLI